ncbi:hypothetical protein LTR10_020320 [Elasticomyces elasticus]|uniref:NCS1 nucleoside transporter n=1 Tax=Exophiala sideris TaxID=1016849 RepID=A0ABR0J7P2_9EURO|nr:hypothetical protein LTR10_020320 [Elasticomyces elasticus]KAK5031583.1 hypothetical protein LTR13_007572 [Exophiala sideris]KAK5058261.1 hypothetical protein LTR69_006665 [Exophiala sideris]KAK5180190.1 hypothetical protein LTR44_007315 [Eurotiomycetes sp. CCFEE 6388]
MLNLSADRFSPKRLSPSRIKARIEPQMHLQVPMEKGVYKDPRWSNPDLDPIKPEDRTWGALDYWAYWCSDLLAPPLASTISAVMSLGFTARQTIPITFCGFLLCSGALTLTGKIGATYHIPFPVLVRSIFGMYGSYPVIVLRAFVAAMWTALLCVQAGDFLDNCITAIWPSFANFPNHLPENAGITSASLLCFMLYWIFQTILACMPIRKLRLLFLIKGIIVPPTFAALFLWGAIVTHGGGPLVTGPTKMTSPYMNTAYSALTALNSIIGLFSSMAVNFADFSRFSKNNLAGYNQVFALPIIGTLGALCPIFVTAAHSYQHGTFQWYMPAVIAQFDSRAAKFFTAFSFILATIGNQVAAGTYPFSNDVSGLCPKYINIFRATLIISVFCVVSNPWQIIKNASGLLAFLSGYSMFMGAICGVVCCHYYIIVKKKLNIHEMYNGDGIYRYNKIGVNWRAFFAFFVAIAPLVPGFAKSINNNLNVGNVWQVYTFSCLYGFAVSGLVYWITCTYVSNLGPAMIDEAVYPPSTPRSEDLEVQSAASEQDAYGEKMGGVEVAIGAKELNV